jgi:hypothetical protein
MPTSLRNLQAERFLQEATSRGRAKGSLIGQLADKAQDAVDLIYSKCIARVLDERNYASIAAEVEARLADSEGVLIARYTARIRDGNKGAIPQYIGLQVVGGGSDEMSARQDYDKRKREHERPVPAPTQCTPANPTGQPQKGQAYLTSAPKGYNMGYGAHIAREMEKIRRNNPDNDSSAGFGIMAQDYYEEELIFITRRQWEAIKQNRNKGGWCGSGDSSSSSGPSASARSSGPVSISRP